MSERPEPKWKPVQWPMPFLAEAMGQVFDTPLMVHRNSIAVRMSRKTMVACGMVEPTPEEQAEMDARHVRYEAERKVRDAAMDKTRVKLAKLRHMVTRAVLELHSESDTYGRATCDHCYDGGDMGDHEDWPCETVRTIAAAYEIEVPR